MHEQMERLYRAAKALKKVEGQTNVAGLLNVSPQVMNNWEARGISKRGMIDAQKAIGCSAVWLETGAGEMVINSSILDSWGRLGQTTQEFIAFIADNVLSGRLADKDIAVLKGRAEQMTETPAPSAAPPAPSTGFKVFGAPEQTKGVKHGTQ